MKVALICTDETPVAMGVKALSSNLIEHGFDSAVLIMASWDDNYDDFHWKDVQEVCKDAGLIGFSCMTHGVKKAVEIKKVLEKNLKVPVIIGGIHASLDPESVFNDFDFVCHGEGEDLIVRLAQCLANDKPFNDIPGLWGRYEGKAFRNLPQPLSKELDGYPFPDYNLDNQFILEHNKLVSMELSHIIYDYFEVMGSRGCPHVCTYCSNYKIKEIFPWRKRVRQYSTDYFIAHLKEICRAYPNVKSFWLEDDTFFAKDISQIKLFADRYKREVNKPFCILISPWTYSAEKTGFLIEAGMDRLIFGVQSGSENTNHNIYGRKVANKKILEIIYSLSKFKGLNCYYDFIGVNPFETSQDLISTISFVKKFPTPFFVYSNNLAFYPGTKMHERAIEANLSMAGRDRHTDAKHGYLILKNENIKHKIFHLLFLMMGGKANKFKIGLIPRIFISEKTLYFYNFLDKYFEYIINKCVSVFSFFMIHTDWKSFLKKKLNREQIESLKKFYHRFFK